MLINKYISNKIKISYILLSNQNVGNIRIVILITEYVLRNKIVLYTLIICNITPVR